jgi:hypothetical protein
MFIEQQIIQRLSPTDLQRFSAPPQTSLATCAGSAFWKLAAAAGRHLFILLD